MKILNDYLNQWKEYLITLRPIQMAHLAFALSKYLFWAHLARNRCDAYSATLQHERIARTTPRWNLSPTIMKINLELIATMKERNGPNILRQCFIESNESYRYREEFQQYGAEYQVRLKYPRPNVDPCRQGDVIVLKPHMSSKERGVLLIQYNDSFKKFFAIFDTARLAKSYRLVLEPSTWGYCDPLILLFLGMETDVIVQAQHHLDFEYIRSIESNLVPLRLGAGDWIDPDRFFVGPANAKVYDIVMVASWQRIKRHELLFRNAKKCPDIVKRIALIGYPSEGRDKEDVMREAKKHGVLTKIDFYESIPRQQVSEIIRQSKIGVMLTVREGSNKGIYECFFSDVPVIISERNIGVNRAHVNPHTGITVEDCLLADGIRHLVMNSESYEPRQWALEHTGYRNASYALNECLKGLAGKNGEEWTQDIYVKKNDTNAQYVFENERSEADKAIDDLRDYLKK